MTKPTFNFCCCCCDLKIGSCIFVAFYLFFSIICVLFVNIANDLKNVEFPVEISTDNPFNDIPSCKFIIFHQLKQCQNYIQSFISFTGILILAFIDCIANIIMSILFFNGVSSVS